MDFGDLIKAATAIDEQRATHYDSSLNFLRAVISEVEGVAAKSDVKVRAEWDQKNLARRETIDGGVWAILLMSYPSPNSEYTSKTATITLPVGVRAREGGRFELLFPKRAPVAIRETAQAIEPVVRNAHAVLREKYEVYAGSSSLSADGGNPRS